MDSTVLQQQQLLYLIWNAPSTWGRGCQRRSSMSSMELLGAKVQSVTDGSCVLKDAVNAALRAWVANAEDTHYIMGSALDLIHSQKLSVIFKCQWSKPNANLQKKWRCAARCRPSSCRRWSNVISSSYSLLRIPLLPCMGQKLLGLSRYRPACSNLGIAGRPGVPSGALMDVLHAHEQI